MPGTLQCLPRNVACLPNETMKQTLQLKSSQRMAQTQNPKLQQRARLLGLSSIDLLSEIQEVLASNMMLEPHGDEADDTPSGIDGTGPDSAERRKVYEENSGDSEGPKKSQGGFHNVPEKLPVQTKREDMYDRSVGKTGLSQLGVSEAEFERVAVERQSLAQHLFAQLNLIPLPSQQREIAEGIIHSLDDTGRLKVSAEELCKTFALSEERKLGAEEVESVLEIVQGLDPAGVAARDLHECLLLQLNRLPEDTPWLSEARRCCSEFANTTFLKPSYHARLMRRLNIGRDALEKVIDLIRAMNPHPCSQYNPEQPEYVIPDVFVYREQGQWKVQLHSDKRMPQLRVNPLYETALKPRNNARANQKLRAQLRDAKDFIKNLESRQETLLRVSEAIIKFQQAFLEQGEEAMKPLRLIDIADKTDLSVSWVSRATARKYIQTPKGIFALKFFFPSPLGMDSGDKISSTAIRAKIKKMIMVEDAKKPLSDNAIANLLSDGGIRVARRTVGKYREAMRLPSSNERKRLD